MLVFLLLFSVSYSFYNIKPAAGLSSLRTSSDDWYSSWDDSDGRCISDHHMFQCADGYCVSFSQICNKEDDCSDGTDENPAFCIDLIIESLRSNCEKDNFCCESYSKIISEDSICDHKLDCFDTSDENPLLCHYWNQQYSTTASTSTSEITLTPTTKSAIFYSTESLNISTSPTKLSSLPPTYYTTASSLETITTDISTSITTEKNYSDGSENVITVGMDNTTAVDSLKRNSILVILITISLLIVIISSIMLWRNYHKQRNIRSMEFENPIYRNTGNAQESFHINKKLSSTT
ncbi:uncharacterized protein LOC142333076 isoform X2 [Lycorma delicatula]|uniref:uncharacterized protein LOC142333076 isoform X2 n=1 Tax=Lycorma delicatula TaxID=130591 RepID=UPI003F514F29